MGEEKDGIRIFTLADTVSGMVSDDYRERFVAEFDQLTYRTHRLHETTRRWDEGTLPFEPACSRTVLHGQLCAMYAYRDYMKVRAEAEGFKPEDFAAWVI